jgi:hypothetical protein
MGKYATLKNKQKRPGSQNLAFSSFMGEKICLNPPTAKKKGTQMRTAFFAYKPHNIYNLQVKISKCVFWRVIKFSDFSYQSVNIKISIQVIYFQ